ncbi:MAG: proteobacterial dedicated sortase system histidine kinase [gamma proteobacterium symbiont of Phacoides pectinatus]
MAQPATPRPFRHSIRFRLLLVSLSVLLIPWVGYRYLQETESYLRQGQEQLLSNTARAAAQMLRGHGRLLASAPDTPAHAIYLHPIDGDINLDGYADEWGPLLPNRRHIGDTPTLGLDLLAATHGGYLYLLIDVSDEQIIYRPPGSPDLDQSDFVELLLENSHGDLRRYRIATLAPGWVRAEQIAPTVRSAHPLRTEPRIQGEWQERPGGYTVELRIPRYLVGRRLSVNIGDRDTAGPGGGTPIRITSGGDTDTPGALIAPSGELAAMLAGLPRENLRLWVLDRAGYVLATQGLLQREEDAFEGDRLQITANRLLRGLLHLALGRPNDAFSDDLTGRSRLTGPEVAAALAGRGESRRRATPDARAMILSATWPIEGPSGVIGAVLAEQSTNQILSLQNRATESLFGITLLLFALLLSILLAFASRLAGRIRRLRDRTEEAVTADGRILGPLSTERSRDEIGDLSRSFAGVLERLGEYNRYLEAMASRLAHELRTPLTLISSSLENLEQDPALNDRQRRYLTRAREGSERLGLILHRMREATRLEQLLQQTAMERFDLGRLLSIAAESYHAVFPGVTFPVDAPQREYWLRGAPDLLSQALDKLVGNAVDFHTPGTPIELGLDSAVDGGIRLSVTNRGPQLPPEMAREVFNSMVSLRPHKGGGPHLGLGLYLARLICEFHGGSIAAENLSDDDGVRFIMTLPQEP